MSGKTVAFAVVAFASTTADDLVVLLTFQSLNIQNKEQTPGEMTQNMWYIAFGQILSYSIIVGIALLGLLLGNFCPEDYVALIGFIPLLLGLKGYYDYFFDNDDDADKKEGVDNNNQKENDEEGISMAAISPLQLTAGVGSEKNPDVVGETVVITASGDIDRDKNMIKQDSNEKLDEEEEESNILSRTFDKVFTALGLNPMVQKVAVAGLIVGADNVAVYISLFAKLKDFSLVVIALVIFYFLLIVYIFMAYYLVMKVPNVSETIDKYAAVAIPALLIALGIFILSESILFEL